MVFIHFPSALTDEENLLKTKFAALLKKKQALRAFLNPQTEPEKVNPLKRSLEPKEAKEFAKKMILTGKISVPERSNTAKTVFKRPQGLSRKLNEGKASAIVSPTINAQGGSFQSPSGVTGLSSGVLFKPFTPSTTSFEPSTSSSSTTTQPERNRFEGNRGGGGGGRRYGDNYNQSGGRYDNFSQSNPRDFNNSDKGTGGHLSGRDNMKKGFGNKVDYRPQTGKTVHVKGLGSDGLTENICREAFEGIGNIIHVAMELERNCGFVTFENLETAQKAINQVNSTIVGSTKLQVSFARRQPQVSDLVGERSAGPAWAAIASNPSHKATFKDKREKISYDDLDI